ncbi:MAG: hypothetical protein AAF206_04745, partial [Bacteroidota bacterium]
MQQATDFSSIEAFVLHLQQKPEILGILQYGRRDYRDMGAGGDFDLNVIVKDDIQSPLVGLHFHIQDIPVDCGIMRMADLREDHVPSDYHTVLTQSEILYDETGEIGARMAHIRQHWQLTPAHMQEGEIAFERFIRQHIVDKFQGRAHEDPVYAQLFLSGNVFYLLEAWMKIAQWNPYDFRGALLQMKQQQPETYQLFARFLESQDLDEKITLTEKLNQAVLAKIGGPWQKGEVVFHYGAEQGEVDEAEKDFLLDLIF